MEAESSEVTFHGRHPLALSPDALARGCLFTCSWAQATLGHDFLVQTNIFSWAILILFWGLCLPRQNRSKSKLWILNSCPCEDKGNSYHRFFMFCADFVSLFIFAKKANITIVMSCKILIVFFSCMFYSSWFLTIFHHMIFARPKWSSNDNVWNCITCNPSEIFLTHSFQNLPQNKKS